MCIVSDKTAASRQNVAQPTASGRDHGRKRYNPQPDTACVADPISRTVNQTSAKGAGNAASNTAVGESLKNRSQNAATTRMPKSEKTIPKAPRKTLLTAINVTERGRIRL